MITIDTYTFKNPDKRTCERVEFKRAVVLKLGQAHSVIGQTINVSLGGVCISINDTIETEWLEQSVLLFLKDSYGDFSPEFSCQPVRYDFVSGSEKEQELSTLCLQLDKNKAAQFGTMLTKGIFWRK